jgi:hypothetical protein
MRVVSVKIYRTEALDDGKNDRFGFGLSSSQTRKAHHYITTLCKHGPSVMSSTLSPTVRRRNKVRHHIWSTAQHFRRNLFRGADFACSHSRYKDQYKSRLHVSQMSFNVSVARIVRVNTKPRKYAVGFRVSDEWWCRFGTAIFVRRIVHVFAFVGRFGHFGAAPFHLSCSRTGKICIDNDSGGGERRLGQPSQRFKRLT